MLIGSIKKAVVRNLLVALAFVAATSLMTSPAEGSQASYTLTDRNSSIVVDPHSQAGMLSWEVDGVDHLKQQWFWYRQGNVAEQSIDSLNLVTTILSDINGDSDDDVLFLKYDNATSLTAGDATFELRISYLLAGGVTGSNISDVAETITIDNLTNSPLPYTIFQYNDYDLDANGADASVLIDQTGSAQSVTQTSTSGLTIGEAISSPLVSHFEAGLFNATGSITDRLNDGDADDLLDIDGSALSGPDDFDWAFQWDFIIPANGSIQISKDKSIQAAVPEPATITLLIAGTALLLGRSRRHKLS